MILKVVSDKQCSFCEEFHSIEVPSGISIDKFYRDLSSSREGGLEIQKALPYLDNEQREILITGFCQKAWDEMFKEEE